MAEDMEADLRLIGTMVAHYAGNDQFDAWERMLSERRKMVEALTRARPYVADLPIVGDADLADLALIDAALTGSTEHGR